MNSPWAINSMSASDWWKLVRQTLVWVAITSVAMLAIAFWKPILFVILAIFDGIATEVSSIPNWAWFLAIVIWYASKNINKVPKAH